MKKLPILSSLYLIIFAATLTASVDAITLTGVGDTGNNTQENIITVPEPATMLLLGTGLAGVAAKLRRRHRANSGNEEA